MTDYEYDEEDVRFDLIFLAVTVVLSAILALLFGSLAGDDNRKYAVVAGFYAFISFLAFAYAAFSYFDRNNENSLFKVRGITYGIIEPLKLRVNPWLAFVYTVPFIAVGYFMTSNGQLAFTRIFNNPGAVNPIADFVLSKISAPFAEELFIRGTAIPFIEGLTSKIFPQEKLAELFGFLMGNTVAGAITAVAHTVAFSVGGVVSFDTLALEFGFSFGQGCLSKVFGALPSISLHMGRNFAF